MFELYAYCEKPGYNNKTVRQCVLVGDFPTRKKAEAYAESITQDHDCVHFEDEHCNEWLIPETHVIGFEIIERPG